MRSQELIDAIAAIWHELPRVLDGRWQEFATRVWALLRRLDDAQPADAAKVVRELLGAFREQPAAYEALVRAHAANVGPRSKAVSESLQERPAHCRYVTIPVLYATDRVDTGGADPTLRFSGERGSEEPEAMHFGVARVAIPDVHVKKGVLETPTLWKLEFRVDPQRHVALLGLETLAWSDFASRARALLGTAMRREVLLFIHGYNVAFDDAARRAAQIAWDLNFPGVPMLYSWPSEGRTLCYTIDEGNVRWTQEHLAWLLKRVASEFGAETVHVIAHSMGSRALAEVFALFDASTLGAGAARMRQIVFAAPDIDASTFARLAKSFHAKAERVTLYASSNDKALAVSHTVHGYARAGDAGDSLVTVEGIDTIDASGVDTSVLGLAHSYFAQKRVVMADMFNLILHGKAPEERFGLAPQVRAGRRYWRLEP